MAWKVLLLESLVAAAILVFISITGQVQLKVHIISAEST